MDSSQNGSPSPPTTALRDRVRAGWSTGDALAVKVAPKSARKRSGTTQAHPTGIPIGARVSLKRGRRWKGTVAAIMQPVSVCYVVVRWDAKPEDMEAWCVDDLIVVGETA